jgi:mannose-6-phosphate isomerase-like protein (cupin superfamily)
MGTHKAVFRRREDCETESWRDPVSGHVDWWTLFSSDRTQTQGLTVGIADIPVGAPRPARGHLHDQAEVYVFLSGRGEVIIEGESTEVSAGDSVFIHGNIEHMAVNTGDKVLRLLYFFATESFKDVVYRFPELNQDK